MSRISTYKEAVAKIDALIALGETEITLFDDADFPYYKVHGVEVGNGWRLNAPNSVYLLASHGALLFRLNVEFENRDANGTGRHQFDAPRLRDVMLRLSPPARNAFADILEGAVTPAVRERTAEIRDWYNEQLDSEDCLRGLIEFARS